jgi:hypothetical protein
MNLYDFIHILLKRTPNANFSVLIDLEPPRPTPRKQKDFGSLLIPESVFVALE